MATIEARILLVDDEPANLLALEAILAELRHPMERAGSGEEALGLVLRADYAVILLDLRMRGMDGLETARQLRQHPRTRSTPIIFISASDHDDRAVAQAYALGAVDFLTKPVLAEVLRAKVAFFVELHRSREEVRLLAREQAQREADAAAEAARAALVRAGEQRFALLLESSGDGIYGMAPDASCTFLNQAGARMLGYQVEELVGRPIHDVIHHHRADGAHYPVGECLIGKASRAGQAIRVDDEVFWHKDGTPVPVHYSVNPIVVDGRNNGAVINFTDVTERRRTEQQLRLSEERYRTLFASMDEGFCLVELLYDDAGAPVDYRFLETNPAFHRQSGLGHAVGKTVLELLPDFETRWFQAYHQVAVTGEPVRFESEFRSLGMWFDVSVSRADSARRLSILFKDVTLRKQSEARLRQSEERVRLATDAAELGLWVWTIALDQVSWENDRLHALFGLPKDAEPVNAARFSNDFVHPDDRQALQQAVEATLTRRERFHFEGRFYRQDDRELRWTEFTGVLQCDENDRPVRIVGTAADITERKRAHAVVAESEERFKSLFESIDEGFSVIDVVFDGNGQAVDYLLLQTNPAFHLQSGLQPRDGQSARELVPQLEASWFATFGEVVRSGEPRRFINQVAALGRTFDVYANRIGGLGSTKAAVVFTDVTEKIRAESELRSMAAALSEADRRKNEFLATLAHELRNPLAPLSSGLHLLRLSDGLPAPAVRTVGMMERQVHHMVNLVDDLLDVARISTGKIDLKLQRAELASLVASAVETCLPAINASGHHVTLDLPDEPVWLDVDPTRISQVLANLLSNASKYTPVASPIVVSATLVGDRISISVIDSGIGIAARSLTTIFDMFTQVGQSKELAQGGLGIGLSLVRKLVELHGGTASAHSDGPGTGSTFTIVLPVAPAPGSSAAAAGPHGSTTAPPAPRGPLKVLVVDDNRDAAETLALVLDIAGHSTRLAHDGPQALEVAADFLPSVVFLDIGLPGLNGYEVARALRKMPGVQHATLVALTGWGAESDRAMSSDAGFDHHFTKPAELAALERLMEKIAASAEEL